MSPDRGGVSGLLNQLSESEDYLDDNIRKTIADSKITELFETYNLRNIQELAMTQD